MLKSKSGLRNRAALIDGATPEFVPVALASPAESGMTSAGGSSRIEVAAAGLTILTNSGCRK